MVDRHHAYRSSWPVILWITMCLWSLAYLQIVRTRSPVKYSNCFDREKRGPRMYTVKDLDTSGGLCTTINTSLLINIADLPTTMYYEDALQSEKNESTDMDTFTMQEFSTHTVSQSNYSKEMIHEAVFQPPQTSETDVHTQKMVPCNTISVAPDIEYMVQTMDRISQQIDFIIVSIAEKTLRCQGCFCP